MTSDCSGRSRTRRLPANRANNKRASSRSRKKLRVLARRWIWAIGFGGGACADWLGTELMISSNRVIRKSGVAQTKTSPLITLMPLIYTELQSKTKKKTSTTKTRRTTPSNSQSQNLTADDADKTDLHGLK